MILIKNAKIYRNGKTEDADILIKDSRIFDISKNISNGEARVIDAKGSLVIPGAIDAHVHLRQPGFEHKETVLTGTDGAAKGGVTAVMAMPNTRPITDSIETLDALEAIIEKDAAARVYPYASLTLGQKGKELTDIAALAKRVKAFSDDGVGVNDTELLRRAMLEVKKAGGIICSHAEAEADNSENAEIIAVRRETELAKQTGCGYHFCHISLEESFNIIKKAREEGYNVTCEVTPHHLFLCKDDIKNTDFKMNPPLRSRKDMLAVQEALLTGVADMVATDHAPHAENEKAADYDKAPNGIIGLETLIPLLYTNLVKTGRATVSDMIKWTSGNPAKRFGIPYAELEIGSVADLAVIDTENPHTYTKEEIVSKSKNSPFIGRTLYGFCKYTLVNGQIKYGG